MACRFPLRASPINGSWHSPNSLNPSLYFGKCFRWRRLRGVWVIIITFALACYLCLHAAALQYAASYGDKDDQVVVEPIFSLFKVLPTVIGKFCEIQHARFAAVNSPFQIHKPRRIERPVRILDPQRLRDAEDCLGGKAVTEGN